MENKNAKFNPETNKSVSLNRWVKMWPTASSRDWKDTPGMAGEGINPDGSKRSRTDQLARKVYADAMVQGLDAMIVHRRVWATPKSSPSGLDYARSDRDGSGGDDLATQAQGQLNPDWVTWLMGFPLGWCNVYAVKDQFFQDWRDRCGGIWDDDPAEVEYFGYRIPRVALRIEHRTEKLMALGNAQVPAVAAIAYLVLQSIYERARDAVKV